MVRPVRIFGLGRICGSPLSHAIQVLMELNRHRIEAAKSCVRSSFMSRIVSLSSAIVRVVSWHACYAIRIVR
jgi:hypothetical protein